MTSASTELAIGPHRLPNRALLAPMAGITDLPFRRMAARFRAGLVVSEMIASEQLADGDTAAVLRSEGEGVGLHVVQLAGCEARWLAEGARIAEAAGANIIDINMGCPAKQVTNGQQAGAALLRDLDYAVSLIEATVAAVRVPVTLKMRLGWDEHSFVAPELARRAQAAGVAMVTVHGRTRAQFYQGRADWPAIARVKEAVTIPVVANGDLTNFDEASAMLAASGADAVMVGRAARGRPWFPGQVGAYLSTGEVPADPMLDVQRDVLLELYESWLHHSGRARGMREARKHVGWALEAAAASLGRTAAWAKGWRAALLSENDPVLVLRGIGDAFDDLGWRSVA
ncbi:MAG TPA: tRNA dihydrouridine synthase DusB [Xanthobacteraceae bacterium]|nr:tRNA dihydrouridine synthase DusB [Xanthobacteraceae bacterium]